MKRKMFCLSCMRAFSKIDGRKNICDIMRRCAKQVKQCETAAFNNAVRQPGEVATRPETVLKGFRLTANGAVVILV